LAQAAAGTGGGHRVPPWGAMSGIASLPEKLANLDEAARADVARVLRIKALEGGEYEVPEPFRSKVARWCGGASDAGAAASDAWTKVLGQRVISVHGIWTYETSNFNPLRTLRPVAGPMASTAGPDAVASACAGPGKCDFCDAERLTVVEPFGRVQGRHSLTAGNVFKSAGVHGLVIWSRHEPHLLTQEEVTDGFRTADEWFDRAAGLEIPEGGGDCYPMMFWNCFRNAGASQVHPHMQLQLFPEPVALGAMLREQGARYIREAKGGRDLCRDVARAHQHLGLAMDVAGASCWASLTPRVGGGELCVLGPAAAPDLGHRPRLANVAAAVGAALRALRRCRAESYSVLGCLVPTNAGEAWLVRCSHRGALDTAVVDAAAGELMGLASVGADPYAMYEALQAEVRKGDAFAEKPLETVATSQRKVEA